MITSMLKQRINNSLTMSQLANAKKLGETTGIDACLPTIIRQVTNNGDIIKMSILYLREYMYNINLNREVSDDKTA